VPRHCAEVIHTQEFNAKKSLLQLATLFVMLAYVSIRSHPVFAQGVAPQQPGIQIIAPEARSTPLASSQLNGSASVAAPLIIPKALAQLGTPITLIANWAIEQRNDKTASLVSNWVDVRYSTFIISATTASQTSAIATSLAYRFNTADDACQSAKTVALSRHSGNPINAADKFLGAMATTDADGLTGRRFISVYGNYVLEVHVESDESK